MIRYAINSLVPLSNQVASLVLSRRVAVAIESPTHQRKCCFCARIA